SPDGKFIVSGSALGKEMIVWDAKKGNKIFEHKFTHKLETVCFSPDNKYILAGGEFNYLSVFETDSWTQFMKNDFPSGIEGMRYSRDGELLALGREDGIILLIDTKNFSVKDSLLHGYHGNSPDYSDDSYRADVNSLDFSPDNRYLVTGGLDGDIKIWYLPERKLIKTINAHNSSIKSLRINNKGNCIASASSGDPGKGDNSIKIWDFTTGNLLHELSSPYGMEAVEFTPSGEFLLGSAREVLRNNPENSPVGFIYVYYIPDDFQIDPIRLVSKEPAILSEYFNFNQSGSAMVTGHEDGSLRVWNVIYK
ncbi:MAG: WD40 repeat domain-containing protein, partial [Bacteroidota bacterium]